MTDDTPAPQTARVRREVHYQGRVQGVGFRYQTCDVASGHAVTGYVRNLPDGRVQLVVEGEATALDAFLAAIRQRMARYIESESRRDAAATGEFRGFSVHRG